MSYTKTTWQNDQAPAINATNLNHIETGIYDNDSNITDIIQNKLGLSISTWSVSETYIEGNVVIYNNNLYRNITGSYTTTNPAEDTTNWEYQSIIATWPLENNTTINPNILPIARSFENTSIKVYSCDYINGDVLWENESPTSSFSSQTIELDLSSYSKVEIIYYTDVEAPAWSYKMTTGRIPIVHNDKILLGGYIPVSNFNQAPQYFGRIATLNITGSGTRGINFTTGKNYSSSFSDRNASGVPLQIIGYK